VPLAESEILPVPVDLVRQNSAGIAAIKGVVSFHDGNEVIRLVEGVKAQPFDPSVTIHQTDMQLRAKLGFCFGFSAHNGPYPRLSEADDSIRNAVGIGSVHEPLLLIYRGDDVQPAALPLCQTDSAFHQVGNKSNVTANILQLQILRLFNEVMPNGMAAFYAFKKIMRPAE